MTAANESAASGPFRGVIFDFNGVLLWDTPQHDRAWREFSARTRGYPFDEKEMAEQVHGRTNEAILTYLLNRPVAGAELRRLAGDKEACYRRLCLASGEEFRLSPGAIELLDFLARQAVPFTIATSSGWDNLTFYLDQLDLPRWFDPARIVYDDGSRPGKPAPDIFLAAAERLGLPPAACVVVEDSPSGITAARSAGIGCVITLDPASEPAAAADSDGLTIPSLAAFPHQILVKIGT